MAVSCNIQSKILQKIIEKVNLELSLVEGQDELDEFLNRYDISLEEDSFPIFKRQHKILVIGDLAGKKDDYILSAKKAGIHKEQIEFEDDYRKNKHFSCAKLAYSTEYSDIIYGPNPHKMKDIGDASSLLAVLENEPNKYPKVIRASVNDALKLSINSFRKALAQTRLLKALNE